MTKLKRVLILLLGALPVGLSAQNLRFGTVPTTVSGVYQLDSVVDLPQTVTVRERGAATSYFVTFSAGSSGTFAIRTARNGANVLSYQIYDNVTNRNVLEDLTANPPLSQVISGTFPASSTWQTQTGNFTVSLMPDQLPLPGTYTDSISTQLYAGTPASPGALAATKTFTVSITVNAALDISIVAPGASFSLGSTSYPLSLGVLTPGGTSSVDLVIRANTLNSVTISSQYGGALANVDITDTSTVPYTLSVNGTGVSLPAGMPQPIVTSAAPTSFSGSRYAISVTVGIAAWPTEGTYTDVLTLQATAN